MLTVTQDCAGKHRWQDTLAMLREQAPWINDPSPGQFPSSSCAVWASLLPVGRSFEALVLATTRPEAGVLRQIAVGVTRAHDDMTDAYNVSFLWSPSCS